MVGKIVKIIMPEFKANEGSASKPAKQIQVLVLPSIMLHTLAVLLYLSHVSLNEASDLKPKEALDKLLNLYVLHISSQNLHLIFCVTARIPQHL